MRGWFLKFEIFGFFCSEGGCIFTFVCVCMLMCVRSYVCAIVRVCVSNGLFLFNGKAGHYGDGNRPGFPKEILVVGKFTSASLACSPLSAMSHPTHQQKEDVATLNMLPDFIVHAYRTGDIVLLAMSQPTSLCIGQQDLVSVFFFNFCMTLSKWVVWRVVISSDCYQATQISIFFQLAFQELFIRE